jgi:hypothetical protein
LARLQEIITALHEVHRRELMSLAPHVPVRRATAERRGGSSASSPGSQVG